MSSENETVHFVTEDMREPVFRYGEVDSIASLRLRDFADRIEAAHRREVKVLRECLNEAVFVMQTLFDKKMPKWRKALEGAKDEGK